MAQSPRHSQPAVSSASIGKYSVADYAAILGIFLGDEHAASLDAEKIYRFAPKLNAHQIRAACDWLRPSGPFSTDQFIEYPLKLIEYGFAPPHQAM